mgnify:CR=1 FL=1
MGLIKAITGAVGGVLADQWKEFFYCDALDSDTLMVKGQKRVGKRSSNTKGSENIISNGSGIAVADGQCMIIVEQGKIVDVCAEPGQYTFDRSTEPSIFAGSLGQSILDSFKTKDPDKTPEQLKADIMQVAHHGYTGGSDALYRAIAAEIILWPVPEFRYDEMLTLPVNSYCKETDKVRAIFISGIDDDTLDMTAPIEARQYFHHGVIRTDLTTGKMLPLNWCCLTGGSTGYTPAKLVYPEEGG